MGNVSASRVSAQMSKFNSKTLVITLRIFLLFFFFFLFFFFSFFFSLQTPNMRVGSFFALSTAVPIVSPVMRRSVRNNYSNKYSAGPSSHRRQIRTPHHDTHHHTKQNRRNNPHDLRATWNNPIHFSFFHSSSPSFADPTVPIPNCSQNLNPTTLENFLCPFLICTSLN